MLLWSIARASAFVAFGAYTGVVVWGILVAGRAFRPAAPAVAFHRLLGSVGMVAIAAHVFALLLDSYAHVTVGSLFGLGPSLSVTLGALAFWLAIGLPLSFRLRQAKFISYRVWRKIHWAGYATWFLMLLHGFFNGTDTGSPYAAAVYAGSVALVGTAVLWRHFDDEPAAAPTRTSPARAE
jgi:methionine sulfoxide reductase heme-binding subunit